MRWLGVLVIKSSRSLHSILVGIDRCLPSFNFKPSEDPETPIQCYYEFLARGILADAPAGCELLFLFVFLLIQSPSLSPAGITLGWGVGWQSCPFPDSPEHLPWCKHAGGSCSHWRALPCPRRRESRQRGEAPAQTTGPPGAVCLIPMGLCYLADGTVHTF